ncbi:hypothetical protein WIS52_20715 [Pseudonocardia nematodicida]|uniref:Uncharacterized protein n=1 Tax=Pseudonocardia nematodicida TaxID=1206997 RepID=A0ABV1KEK1_9PSEU
MIYLSGIALAALTALGLGKLALDGYAGEPHTWPEGKDRGVPDRAKVPGQRRPQLPRRRAAVAVAG